MTEVYCDTCGEDLSKFWDDEKDMLDAEKVQEGEDCCDNMIIKSE